MAILRNALVDEILQLGVEIPEDTVSILAPSDYAFETPDVFDIQCLPIFPSTFTHIQTPAGWMGCHMFGGNKVDDEVGTVYVAQVFVQSETTIGYFQHPVAMRFNNEGYLIEYMVDRKNAVHLTKIHPKFDCFDDFMSLPIVSPYHEGKLNQNDPDHYCLIDMFLASNAAFHDKANEVTLVNHPRNVAKRVERKTGKAPSPYFEIIVKPKSGSKRFTSSTGTGRKKSAHAVRASIATYTEDAPLFGHYVGTVVRKAHTRGSKGETVKAKDYRIVLPKKES